MKWLWLWANNNASYREFQLTIKNMNLIEITKDEVSVSTYFGHGLVVLLEKSPLTGQDATAHAVQVFGVRVVASSTDSTDHGGVDRLPASTELITVGTVVAVNDKGTWGGMEHGDGTDDTSGLSALHGFFNDGDLFIFIQVLRHLATSALDSSSVSASSGGRVGSMLHDEGWVKSIAGVRILLVVTFVPREFSSLDVVPESHVTTFFETERVELIRSTALVTEEVCLAISMA